MKKPSDNISTFMASMDDVLAAVPDAAALHARVLAYLPHAPRFGTARGHRIFWLDGGDLRFRDVVDDPRGFAIIGRHTRAHVHLAGDGTVALRHLLVRSRTSPAGAPELHMSDLLAPLPIFIDGSDEPHHACIVEGEFTARLGAHALSVVPFDGCAPLDDAGGPGRGDRPDVDDDEDTAGSTENADDIAHPFVAPRRPPQRLPARGLAPALVRPLAAPPARRRDEGTLRSIKRTTHIGTVTGARVEAPRVVLDVLGPRGRATAHLGDEDLESTVIIGRYGRCQVALDVFSDHVSRMHAALRRVEDGIEVVDLASTHGLTREGVRVRRALVTDDATFELAEAETVRIRVLR